MPQYTVRDDRGRTITFDWNDPNPPTDADLEEVFASAPDAGAAKPESTKAPESAKVDPRSQVRLFPVEGDESLGTTIGRAVRESPIGMLGTAGEKLYGAFKAHPVESAATLGALAAVPLSGGTSLIPMMAAAGLGGVGGAALGKVGSGDVNQTPTEALRDIAAQGAYQAAGEGVGGLVTRGATKLGHAMYDTILGATPTLRKKLPGLAARGLAEGIPVTKGGAETALEGMMASKADADALLAAAEVAGTHPRISPREVTRGFKDLRPPKGSGTRAEVAPQIAQFARQVRAELTPKAAPSGITEVIVPPRTTPFAETGDEAFIRAQAELGPLAGNVPQSVFRPTATEVRAAAELGPTALTIPRSVLNPPPVAREPLTFISERVVKPQKPSGLSLKESANLVRRLEKETDPVFKAERAGGQVASLVPRLKKEMVEAIRNAQATRVGQPLKDVNQRTRELYGLADAIANTAGKPHRMSDYLSLGTAGAGMAYNQDPWTGLASGLAMRGLLTPAAGSYGALGLHRLGKTELAQLMRAALLAKLGVTSQTEP